MRYTVGKWKENYEEKMNEWMNEMETYIPLNIRLIYQISKRFTYNQRFTSDELPVWVEQSQDLMLRSTVSFIIVTYLDTFWMSPIWMTYHVCLSVCLSFCLSICLFVYLSVCLFVCLYVCLFIYLSVLPIKKKKRCDINWLRYKTGHNMIIIFPFRRILCT